MRRPLLLALLPALLSAAPALQIVRPVISQMDGGAPVPPGFEHVGGESLYVMCRVTGYSKSEDEKVHLRYSVQAFDPKGLPLDEMYQNEIQVEVSPKDTEWMPKIATEVSIPPLAGPGAYKLLFKVEDVLAKTTVELPVPFQVRAHEVESSETLVVRNFHFYRDEEGAQPVEKAAYRPGDGVWAKFDIIGYKFGEKNKIDLEYVTSVIAPGEKVLWTQPESAVERSESFYPKRYVPAAMGINLQKTIRAGEYMIAVRVKDTIGGQSYEGKYSFTIE